MLLRAHMWNITVRGDFLTGPWLIPNGLTQAFKELLTPGLLLCAPLWDCGCPLVRRGNWETCTVFEGIAVALSSFSFGAHLWKVGLSEEAEIVLGWFGCFCLTWTIVSLLWWIEIPSPNLWVFFFMLLALWFVLFIYGLPLIFTSLFKYFVYIFLNFFITPCMFLLAVSNSI